MQKLGGCLPERCSKLLEPPSSHNTQPWGQRSVTTEMLNPRNNAGMSALEAHL